MTIIDTINQVLERTPEWIRHDLTSKDSAKRTQAEEALAGMIAAALTEKSTIGGPMRNDR